MIKTNPDPEVLAGFLDEASQCVATLNEKLLAVESGASAEEVVGEMFRAAHSMKGAAGFLNLAKVAKVTHHLETVLDRVRKGKLQLGEDITDALFAALDTISSLLTDLAGCQCESTGIEDTISSLEAVLGEETPAAGTRDPSDDLGEVPAFIRGMLTVDDVLETLIAKNGGETPWLLRIPLSEIFSCGRDPIEIYHALEKAVRIQTTVPLIAAPDSVWGNLQDYDCQVAVLCYCRKNLSDALEPVRLPSCEAYELCRAGGLREPLTIRSESAVSVGERIGQLTINPGMAKHLSTWLSETQEELYALDSSLMTYEKNPEDKTRLHEIFRLMHRMKGSCASMGLEEMARAAHNCESLLSRYRETDAVPGEDGFKALFAVKDFLNDCLKRVNGGIAEAPDAGVMDAVFLRLFNEEATAEENSGLVDGWVLSPEEKKLCAEAAAEGLRVWKLAVELDPDSPLADLRYGMILNNLDQSAAVILSHPSLAELEQGIENVPYLRVLVAGKNAETVRNAAQLDMVIRLEIAEVETGIVEENQTEAKAVATQAATVQAKGQESVGAIQDTVRVDVSRLDYLINVAGELAITKARISQLSEGLASRMRSIDTRGLEFLIWHAKQNAGNGSALTFESIRNAEQWLGEIKSAQEVAGRLRDTAVVLHRHTSSIQNCVMQVRMVPIGPLFQRFHRLVRDVCKERNRKAVLITNGENTELDKKLIDELADPLTHLIRNSVDHGLETPEERLRQGKCETGSIRLEAFHEGGQICIRISDDGRGLDRDKIRKKALENGLVTEASFQKMSDQEIYALIFQPGFSTAEKVTSISGRGVGMDIVRSKINELKGKIDIESRAGEGASFTIRLPLTLAMIDALLVRVGQGRYALPLESVKEIVEVAAENVHATEGGGRLMTLREDVIAFVEPSRILGIEAGGEAGAMLRAVIVRNGSEFIALSVDEVLGKEEIVVKPLSEEFAGVRGISGATVLGDGGIALILETGAIGELSKNGGVERCRAARKEEAYA
jgi:two-component system chemotaxis sensor kinase CheA